MSNLRNRFLALAVVVVMLVAALGSTVSAATSYVDVTSSDDNKMIKLLSAIGIVKGTGDDADGNPVFDPDTPVTRQQMALFLARIHSATPGAFISDDSVKIPFTDVKDATYFLAIQYCVEQNIINGRSAEEFDPTATVTLDEALAMIVRALGYKDLDTSKNFIESTKKAKELGFALTYKDTEGKKELDRIEVMRLLYKYFYSDEQSLEIVKNEATGVQHTVRVPHPVMEKFGINVQEAYIVRADDYTAEVGVTLETPNGDTLTSITPAKAPSLTAKELADGKDIILAYNNFKVVSTNNYTAHPTGYTYSGKWFYIAVKRADIGLTKDDTARNNVGLKTVYYVDSLAATRPEALDVISYVKGTKTQVDLADKDNPTSAKMNDDLDNFSDYATALTILGKTYDLRTNVNELTDADIYQFNKEAILKANTVVAGAANNTVLKQLGGFIKKGGNFGLEYVENDWDTAGNVTEFYFIFTPYTVGYHNGNEKKDDDVNESYKLDGTASKTLNTKNVDTSKNVKVNDINKVGFESGNAYLYTVEGQNLNIFAKLEKRVDKKYPQSILTESKKLVLNGLTISIDSKNSKFAINATTSLSNMQLGAETSAFSSTATSDIFYVYRHNDGPSASDDRKYGVLMADPTPVSAYLTDGQYTYLYKVFSYANNRTEEMTYNLLVSDYYYYSTVHRKLEKGDLVSYQWVGNFYRIGAFDDMNYLYKSENGWAATATLGVRAASGTISSGNLRLGYMATGLATNYDPLANVNTIVVNGLRGIVTSDTEILVSQYSSNSAFTPDNFVTARKFTKAEFDTWWNTNPTNYTIEMITVSGGIVASAARVIHIKTRYTAADNNDVFATVTKLAGSGDSVLTLAVEAFGYLTGETYKINVGSGLSFSLGEVVRITPEEYTTIDGVKYWNAQRIPTYYSTNASVDNGAATRTSAFRGYFTLPSKFISDLSARLVEGNATNFAGFNNILASNFNAYPIFQLTKTGNSGVVYAGLGNDEYARAWTTIDMWSREAVIYTATAGTVSDVDPKVTAQAIWDAGTAITLYAKTEAALTNPTNGLTNYVGKPAEAAVGDNPNTGVEVDEGETYIAWKQETGALGVKYDVVAKQILTERTRTINGFVVTDNRYYADEVISSAADLALITEQTYISVASSQWYKETAGVVNKVRMFNEYNLITENTERTAVSQLNGRKVNWITVKVYTGGTETTAAGKSATSINSPWSWRSNNMTIEFGTKNHGDIPTMNPNPWLSTAQLMRKYYVITNNLNEDIASDVVTIIEFVEVK